MSSLCAKPRRFQMTDQRLRSRERAASLDPAAESALLRERVRAGRLSPERLELAAYCGHEWARIALGRGGRCHNAGCVEPLERHPCLLHGSGNTYCLGLSEADVAQMTARHSGLELRLDEFVRGLSSWGQSVQVRAAVLACEEIARRCLVCGHPWQKTIEFTPYECESARAALEVARAFLGCPCEEHLPGNLPSLYPALVNEGETRCFYRLLCCLSSALNGWNTGANGSHDAVEEAARLATPEAVCTAIQQGLTAWALGGEP